MGKEFARSEGIRVQVTNEQAQQIRKLYKELSDEYKERLRILSTKQTVSARIREQYLKDYVKDLERDMQYLNNNLENTITSNMLRVAEAVVDDSLKLDKEMGFGGIMTKQFYIPQDVVVIVTSGELYKGKWSLSGAIWSTNQKQLNDINSVVAKGIAGNKSAYEIAKDLERYVNPSARKDWNWSKVYPNTNKKIDYNAQRLARTMVSHAYQESFVECTKDNPFIESYRWLASGGDRMCPVCEERDGQIYSKDDLPMDHPNGMCTFEVVIEKSYEEIGRELADWVNGEGDPELNAQIDNYADSLGFNVKQMTAGTELVRKAERVEPEIKKVQVDLSNTELSESTKELSAEFAERMNVEDVEKFNRIFNEAEVKESTEGSYYDPVTGVVYVSKEEPNNTSVFHESTHYHDYKQNYTITEDYGRYKWLFDANGDALLDANGNQLKEWIPDVVTVKENAGFSQYIAYNWGRYDKEGKTKASEDLQNFVKIVGTSDTYGNDRKPADVERDVKAINAYISSKGISKTDPDYVHLSDFISAISYDASLGSFMTGGHDYEYFLSDEHRVAEITVSQNLLRCAGREDLLDIERELAPNLMKMLEEEWEKVW